MNNSVAEHHDMLTVLMHSKTFNLTGFGAAAATLGADKIASSAPALPAAINWIGTHGPAAWFSWADVMAVGSGALIALNLFVFAVRGYRWIKAALGK